MCDKSFKFQSGQNTRISIWLALARLQARLSVSRLIVCHKWLCDPGSKVTLSQKGLVTIADHAQLCENIRVGTLLVWLCGWLEEPEPSCWEEDIHLTSETLGLKLLHSIVGKTQMPHAFDAISELIFKAREEF